ncbi:MAG: hypothetical protein AB1427_00795 [Thermodesulfobacteriota bacterium]
MKNQVIEIRLKEWPDCWTARLDFPDGGLKMYQGKTIEDVFNQALTGVKSWNDTVGK